MASTSKIANVVLMQILRNNNVNTAGHFNNLLEK